MAENAPVVNYKDLDLKINDDGTYEYPFYHYTYFLTYDRSKNNCLNPNLNDLQNFIDIKINANTKIKKILCFYCDNNNLLDPIDTIKINFNESFNESFTVEYLDILNTSTHSGLNDKYNLLSYLWNNGFNSLLQIVCGNLLDLSEKDFIISDTIKKGNNVNVLTLKFDPNLVPPPLNLTTNQNLITL